MITFFYGSGSPYAWKVQLALEHKALPYERRLLSFSAGDTKKPEFLAINPRGRVPALVDDGFVLYESNAIVEYLEDAYPGRGTPLFPSDARSRATVRRLIAEVDNYVEPAIDKLLDQAYLDPEAREAAVIESTRRAVREELAAFTRGFTGDYLAGTLSAADYALYPQIAFLFRVESKRLPDIRASDLLTPALLDWKTRIERLPYYAETYPPHWKES